MTTVLQDVQSKAKGIKRGIILTDAAIIILGLVMVLFPGASKEIICRVAGIALCVLGVIRAVTYFSADKTEALGSFALVEGAAMAGFGFYFLIKPEYLAAFLTVALAIVLIVGGVMKLQYAVDFMRMSVSMWWVELIGAALTVALGIVALLNPFAASDALMVFIGISFLVDGIWDLISVIFLVDAAKKVRSAVDQAVKNAGAIDVDSKDVTP